MDIDIFLGDDHPHRDLKGVSPEYLRFALNQLFKEIHTMVTQEFTDALAALVAAVKASGDPAAVATAVAASQAEDLQAVTDLTAAQTPTPPAA